MAHRTWCWRRNDGRNIPRTSPLRWGSDAAGAEGDCHRGNAIAVDLIYNDRYYNEVRVKNVVPAEGDDAAKRVARDSDPSDTRIDINDHGEFAPSARGRKFLQSKLKMVTNEILPELRPPGTGADV